MLCHWIIFPAYFGLIVSVGFCKICTIETYLYECISLGKVFGRPKGAFWLLPHEDAQMLPMKEGAVSKQHPLFGCLALGLPNQKVKTLFLTYKLLY